jgi:glycerol-3-phosphate dehydrogenase
VKGSHIVLPRLHAHDRAYLLPNDDGRFVFAVPFAGDFTLIGTTDVDVSQHSVEVAASSEEILYLCRVASNFFREPVKPSSVKWTFAGVRTLRDDGKRRASEVTRDYWIDREGGYGEPPLLSIYGGKLTTYRRLAEKVVARLGDHFSLGAAWTHREPLPGGDLPAGGLVELTANLCAVHPFLAGAHARRLAYTYGTRAWSLLDGAKTAEDLGSRIVGDLYDCELDYLRRHEWAVTPEDVLWRRTKLGLTATPAEIKMLDAAMTGDIPAKLAG